MMQTLNGGGIEDASIRDWVCIPSYVCTCDCMARWQCSPLPSRFRSRSRSPPAPSPLPGWFEADD